MVVDGSKKLIFTVDLVLILVSVIVLISAGWFGHGFVYRNDLDWCLAELKETQTLANDCVGMVDRSNNLLSSLEIHVTTCQNGYKYLEGIARTCLFNESEPELEIKESVTEENENEQIQAVGGDSESGFEVSNDGDIDE